MKCDRNLLTHQWRNTVHDDVVSSAKYSHIVFDFRFFLSFVNQIEIRFHKCDDSLWKSSVGCSIVMYNVQYYKHYRDISISFRLWFIYRYIVCHLQMIRYCTLYICTIQYLYPLCGVATEPTKAKNKNMLLFIHRLFILVFISFLHRNRL